MARRILLLEDDTELGTQISGQLRKTNHEVV
jgi:DNA-binding response OmpR family regulator